MHARSLGILAIGLSFTLVAGETLAGPRGGGGGRGGAGGAARGGRPSAGPSGGPSAKPDRPAVHESANNGATDRVGKPADNFTPGDAGRNPDARNVEEFLGTKKADGAAANREQGQLAQSASLYAPDSKPFTAEWYLDHPNAWKATHPHADAWAVATAASVATWLAIPIVAWDNYATSATTAESGDVDETTSDDSASELANAGSAATSDGTEWMTIGVYVLVHDDSDDATRMIQLEVSKAGVIRGTHYDLISEEVEVIQGAVDKETLAVAWKVGPKGQTVFQTALPELTKPTSPIKVQFPSGSTSTWQLKQPK